MSPVAAIRVPAALYLALAALAFLLSCGKDKVEEGKQDLYGLEVFAERESSGRDMQGCSPRAWIGGKGNAGDSGYCSGYLKLPLSHEPAWEWEYSPAEFSDSNLSTLLHYDGTLFVSAYGTQIAGLDAATGKQRYNAVEFSSISGSESSREWFPSLYLHASGLLLGSDNLGRRYCWEPRAEGLELLWLRSSGRQQSFMGVPVPGSLVACYQDSLAGLELLSGEQTWERPIMQRNRRFRDNSNIVATDEGTLLWCSGFGDSEALDPADGSVIWSSAGPATLRVLALDTDGSRAYLGFQDEHLECRSMANGDLLWEYDWSGLVPGAERDAIEQQLDDDDSYRAVASGLSVSQGNAVLTLRSGYCVWLNPDGSTRWSKRLNSMANDVLIMDNAVVLTQYATVPRSELHRRDHGDAAMRVPPWPGLERTLHSAGVSFTPYQEGQINDSLLSGQRGGFALAVRYSIRDLQTGEELDGHEIDLDFNIGPIPAYNMLVAGGGRRLSESLNEKSKAPRILQAFDWINWEGT